MSTLQYKDLGAAITNLIELYTKDQINTIFLCKVNSVNEDGSVDIVPLKKKLVISNVKVVSLSSKEYQFKPIIKKDQLGLALVNQTDISTFSKDNIDYPVNTDRYFDIQDALFLPCNFDYEPVEDNQITCSENLLINSKKNLGLEANKLALKGAQSSLKEILNEFLDNLKSAQIDTPQGAGAFNASFITKVDATIQKIEELFYE